MPKVRNTVRLHESTVQRAAKGETMAHRRAKGKTGTAASPVEVTRPAEGLWKMVKDLGIPRNHVQRHRDGAITIWNHPAPWPGSERGK